jgi:hypothetical protein
MALHAAMGAYHQDALEGAHGRVGGVLSGRVATHCRLILIHPLAGERKQAAGSV